MTKDINKSISAEELKSMLQDCPNVKILGDFRVDTFMGYPSVYRYTKYAYAKELFHDGVLAFASPVKWEDPFERRFFEGDYSGLGFFPKPFACISFTLEHGKNEAAAWNVHAKNGDGASDGDGVQLTFDLAALLKSLNAFAADNGATIYVESVDYEYALNELKSAGKDSFLQGVDLEKFGEEDFIRLMGLKRRAFAFEEELRIFVYGGNLKFDDGLLKIPVEKKALMVLKLNPKPSSKIFPIENDAIVKFLKEDFPGLKIEQSRLYDKVSKFKPVR